MVMVAGSPFSRVVRLSNSEAYPVNYIFAPSMS